MPFLKPSGAANSGLSLASERAEKAFPIMLSAYSHHSPVISVKSAPDYVVAMALDFSKRTKSIPPAPLSRILISLSILLALAATSAGLFFWLSRSSHQNNLALSVAVEGGYFTYFNYQITNQSSPPNDVPDSMLLSNSSAPPTSVRWCWFLCWSPPSPPPSSPSSPPPPPPSPCSSGSYSTTGTAPCSQCPAGSYCSGYGLTAPTGLCFAGSYSSGGAASSFCTTCPSGKYCSTRGLSVPDGTCPAGSFAPSGASSCTLCSAGQFQPLAGQSHCVACPAGSYCSAQGLSAPDGVNDACPEGSFADSGASSPSCTLCPPGQIQPLPGQRTCSVCPAGKHCSTAGLSSPSGNCSAGSYSSGGAASASCTACPVGNYCPHHAMHTAMTCPLGSFCPSTGLTAAILCTPGMYCAGTGLIRESGSCAAGSFSSGGAATSECMLCPAGMYQDAAAQASCKECPAGSFCDGTNKQIQSIPLNRLNFILHNDGYLYSTLADVFVYSSQGDIHQDSWLSLPSGWEIAPDTPGSRQAAAAFSWSSHAVVLASGFGIHTGSGKDCKHISGRILEQNDIMYRPRSAGMEFNVFIRTMSRGSITSYFVACAEATYQNATGKSKCEVCPVGSHCPSIGLKAPVLCKPGSYSNQMGSVSCKYCPIGSMCPSYGLSAPTACAEGTYNTHAGETKCIACSDGNCNAGASTSMNQEEGNQGTRASSGTCKFSRCGEVALVLLVCSMLLL